MPGPSLAVHIHRISGDQETRLQDSVAVEEPLEIQLASSTATNSAAKSVSITMRTPGDDIELAVGFLHTEGILRSASDIESAKVVGAEANAIRVNLKPQVEIDIGRLQRHFYTTSSCGVCGKASLDALRATGLEPVADDSPAFRRDIIVAMPEKLRAQQKLFSKTGGLHAAAAFDHNGEIIVLREDVGRHNAVDKVIGWLLLNGKLPATEYALLVSGRASFELMQKAVVARMPLLAAVGAPSSLAIDLAKEFHMTLIGFLRGPNFNIYAAAQRVTDQ
jgi:FdhD protein